MKKIRLLMATAAMKALTVSKNVMQELLNSQFVPQAPVYEMGAVILTVPAEQYQITSKDVPAIGNKKPWTAHEAKFEVNKTEIVLRYRSGVEPDQDADLVVARFTANRNWPSDTEITVAKGTVKLFVVNAG